MARALTAKHPASPAYQPRRPEKTILHQVLAEHLETFLARVDADETRAGLPRFVVREFRAFLDCGIPARGPTASFEELVDPIPTENRQD